MTSYTYLMFFFLIIRRPPKSTLFPSTPLFRSNSLIFSPSEANRIGRPVTETTERAAPPRASPSSLVRTIPSKSAYSWNACATRSEEHTSELQSRQYLVCRLLLEKKKKNLYNT